MGYTICYHVMKSSRLHFDSMPRSVIRAVNPRTIAHMSASRSCSTARQRANHRLGNPNILNSIQTPQIANRVKSHTYKRLGGIPSETAEIVRTPLVAQALLPALFCTSVSVRRILRNIRQLKTTNPKNENANPRGLARIAAFRVHWPTLDERKFYHRVSPSQLCSRARHILYGCGLYLEPSQ